MLKSVLLKREIKVKADEEEYDVKEILDS